MYRKKREEKTKMKEFMDYAVRNWGFENESTIELFQMVERGESYDTIQEFIELVEAAESYWDDDVDESCYDPYLGQDFYEVDEMW